MNIRESTTLISQVLALGYPSGGRGRAQPREPAAVWFDRPWPKPGCVGRSEGQQGQIGPHRRITITADAGPDRSPFVARASSGPKACRAGLTPRRPEGERARGHGWSFRAAGGRISQRGTWDHGQVARCEASCDRWRGGRVVDGSGLENRRPARVRGFESHPLRSLRSLSPTGFSAGRGALF